MAEYNGTIDLISGLRPKNGGSFPLVNAPDVLLTDGRRLSDIDFDNLGGSDTFPVTFVVDPETMEATCDKTFAEISTASGEGKFIYGTFGIEGIAMYAPFVGVIAAEEVFALFECTVSLMAAKLSILVLEGGTVEVQMSEIGGDSETPPTQVDLTRLDSDGVIEESYADGSVKTTTLEYDTTGNPVKITDGDGNVTEIVW